MVRISPDVEFRHLRYFITAAEQGSFRKAAAVLKVRESTISRRVRDLEDRVGASLFHRHSSGVYLTHAGQNFLRKAQNTLRHIREGIRDVGAIGRSEEGQIRIGLLSSIASGFLAELLKIYCKRHSKIAIRFIDGGPAELVAAVRQFRLDVVFAAGTRGWPDCNIAPLWLERVFLVLPRDHHLSKKSEVEWREIADEMFIVSEAAPGPEIHDYLIQRFASLGHRPEIQSHDIGRDNLLSLVTMGQGLTLTSEATTATQIPGISYRPIAGELLPFNAIWSPRNDNPSLRRLLSLAREIAN